jgi:hypothetical protein
VNDTLVISLAGILTSGVVGPWVGARWASTRQRDEFKNDWLSRRSDDLRGVLDEAATLLASGASMFRRAAEARASGERIPDRIDEWSEQAHLARERLRLRIRPDDPVISRYEAARERLIDYAKLLGQESGRVDPDGPALDAFESARADFLEAARAALAKAPEYL